jgi:hypothetical protein
MKNKYGSDSVCEEKLWVQVGEELKKNQVSFFVSFILLSLKF